MTRKENIKAILECHFTGFKEEIIDSACNRILEQEPCEDTVSRRAVINQIFYSTDNNGDVVLGSTLRERIARLPSVAPQEPKTGHWERISIDKYSEHAKYWYRCDRCGKDNLGNTDWCPNCGCRMVEPQEGEE